ncbi:MAG: hypothetical protein KF773_43030 [Deltaproteobacteria bacterium]|nr:hypothetical protein [Deltaproteobacteria bacterium]
MGMLRTTALLAGLVALFASACGPSKENTEICQKAADRYAQCVGEVMGEEMKKMVTAPEKDGRAQCANHQKTVDYYRDKCLPKSGCREFLECTTEMAMQDPE